MNENYVLITPAKNEEYFIEDTIKSVIKQTLLPQKWVIVDDGSADKTSDIVRKYVNRYCFIELITLSQSDVRNFGSKAKAFNCGYKIINKIDYNYIGNLDADVTFESNYFKYVINEFICNERLGICGGHIYDKTNDKKYVGQPIYQHSVAGAVQMLRRECYEGAGGLQPMKHGGEDARIEIIARMQGWQVKTLFNLKVYHHKPIGSGVGHVLKNRFREGQMDCSLGYSLFFELIRNTSHVVIKPYLIGSFVRTCGYLWGTVTNKKKAYSKDVQSFLRTEQIDRMLTKLKKGFCIYND